MSETVERFTNRVADYVKYRPGYPREIVAYLTTEFGLSPDLVIADIGSGPGISSRIFLENGNRVYGVEPNRAMRDAAAEYLAGFPRFTSIDGRSDDTHLSNASVDMVVAAQAFHWFEPDATRAEFKRILRGPGLVVLIWNERQLDTTPFLIEYEQFLVKYSTDYQVVRHENIKIGELEHFFQGPFEKATFPNVQVFDFDGLRGRMSSSSYMPTEADEQYRAMIDELHRLFAKHSENGRIEVFYDTNVYVSRSFLWQ